jgi:hypothetical protein
MIFTLLLGGISYADVRYAKSTAGLYVDGKQIVLSSPMLIINSSSMLPMRDFFEALKADVVWDGKNRSADVKKGDIYVTFPIDSRVITKNDRQYEIDIPATIINNVTYIPIRAAGESLGYKVTWADNRVYMEKGLEEDEAQGLKPYIHTNEYNKDSYTVDRNYFATLLDRAKKGEDARKTLYEEYISYAKDFSSFYDAAYKSKRGFILFSPELTEKLNIAFVNMYARKNLLMDINKKQIKDLESYYSASKRYSIVNYDSWTVYETKNGITKSMPLNITHTDKFNHYNQDDIINLIEKLPINDYFLCGTSIMFINGRPNANLAGYNRMISIRGFDQHNIVLFNNINSESGLKHTVVHEIGHSVGKEIFNQYPEDNFSDATVNSVAQKEYAGIYGQEVKEKAEREDSVDENFAEDFAQIYYGGEKWTSWKGNYKKWVQNFIEKELSQIQYYKIPTAKGLKLITSDANIPNVNIKTFCQDYYITHIPHPF